MIEAFINEYAFLSNFYPCPVELDGVVYPSTEHAYQAAKHVDPVYREQVRMCRTASLAKQMGRSRPAEPDWTDRSLQVMESLLRQKFALKCFAEMLESTEGQEIVEGNWWGDTFWGTCKGQGENHLGKILMRIRDEK